jgi:hypothetical protein
MAEIIDKVKEKSKGVVFESIMIQIMGNKKYHNILK